MTRVLVAALCAWIGQDPHDPKEEPVVVPGDPTARLEAPLRENLGRWNPREDDWGTEVFHQSAQRQLEILLRAWTDDGLLEPGAAAGVLAPDFVTAALRPPELRVDFDDGVLRVRSAAPLPPSPADENSLHGPEGLARALGVLAQPFHGSAGFHASLKTFEVVVAEAEVTTRSFYLAEGRPPSGFVQQNAVWTCSWTRPVSGAPPLLRSIRVSRFEEVTAAPGEGPLFADCSEALFGTERVFREQLLPGQNYWQSRLSASEGISSMGHQGVAIGDVDGDGLEDVFLCQPGGLPNRLLLHQPDGSVIDASADSGVDHLDIARCALLLDLDNDGDLDLVVDLHTEVVVFSNDGAGRFTVEFEIPAPETTMLAAADYDGDGLLDLYVCGYLDPFTDETLPTPYHDANHGLPNLLLRNHGDWTFEDVTETVGLDVNNRRFSFAAAWEDYDNDGDQDLYVANDFGRNNLYRNDDGRFVDVAAAAGVEDSAAGMGVTWADYNQDGWMDLYVSNMYSSAGKRIAYQREFQEGSDDRTRAEYRRHARGNSLFENLGDGTFRDVTQEANVAMGRWAWGAVFADLNNDSWPEPVVPNGFFTNDRLDDL